MRLWFKAKHYGWGWYPCTWEGWLVLLVWALVFAFFMIYTHDFLKVTGIVLSIIILIAICWKTGETPRWRWG